MVKNDKKELTKEELIRQSYIFLGESILGREVLRYGDDYVKATQEILSRLTPKEEGVIRLHYGLDGKPHTLQDIANINGITRECARQIEMEAFKKLRKNDNQSVIKDYALTEEELKEKQERLELEKQERIRMAKEGDIRLEDMNLSVIAYRCLKRANINSFKELAGKTDEELLQIKSLGKSSFKEIHDLIEQYTHHVDKNIENENVQTNNHRYADF